MARAGVQNGTVTADRTTGRLLVSTPTLDDGVFHRSVILMLQHDDNGAQGVVLNKPLGAEVDAVLPGWGEHIASPQTLFQGGPVQVDSALGLVTVSGEDDLPPGGQRLFGSVAIIDLDESAASDAAGRLSLVDGAKAIGVGCDVSDAASVDAAIARVVEELGGVHVLVNNAGITRDNLLFKMTVEEWDSVMAVHLRGAFNTVKAAQKYMTEAKFGRIVNLSSTSALGNRGQANYSAAKAGLQGYTKTLAIELGKFGVTANAVAPGFIQTDMTRATAERIGVPFEDFIAHSAQQIPVARVGQPEDIAATIAFLVSQEAGFVSGQVIYVAGGPLD